MTGQRILIISPYTLFVEAIVHVLHDEGIEVAATARDLEAALPLIQAHQPDTIIIDADEHCAPDPNLLGLLIASHGARQVIFFTLDSNRMVVHQRRQVGNATPADLVSLLRYPTWPDSGNGDARLAS